MHSLGLMAVTLLAGGIVGTARAQIPPAGGPTMRGDGPPPKAEAFHVTRADPGLDAIVPAHPKLELLADGFGLNEGPVWMRDGTGGFLIVSDLLDNVLYKIDAQRHVSVFLEKAGYSGSDVSHVGAQTRSGRSHVLLIGPSCASVDREGRLVWCADNDRAIMRLEKDGTRTVLAAGAQGKHFSGPNDLVITAAGSIYFTDNDFGLRDAGKSPLKELPNGIWLIRDGQAQMVLEDKALGGIPNGIALSPNESYLYLTAGRRLMRYEVKPDGTLGGSSLFAEGDGIGDGMKVDRAGNLYSTGGAGPGIIRVTSADGRLLGLLHLPIYAGEPKRQICATNLAFGERDARSLFITACDAVYRIRLKAPGVMPGPPS